MCGRRRFEMLYLNADGYDTIMDLNSDLDKPTSLQKKLVVDCTLDSLYNIRSGRDTMSFRSSLFDKPMSDRKYSNHCFSLYLPRLSMWLELFFQRDCILEVSTFVSFRY